MHERLREEMVQQHVINKGITDKKVIAALGKVPRHLFVQPAMSHQAYEGKSLPIGFGQTISHPTTVAFMSQLLELAGDEKILEIGTGSGYQAAVLSEMGAKVYSLERIRELGMRAQQLFDQLGYFTIGVRVGDGTVGWNTHAPYDRIIVTASSPEVPETLLKQLAENGRMIIPVGEKSNQRMMIITRETGEYHVVEDYTRKFVPLIGKDGWSI